MLAEGAVALSITAQMAEGTSARRRFIPAMESVSPREGGVASISLSKPPSVKTSVAGPFDAVAS